MRKLSNFIGWWWNTYLGKEDRALFLLVSWLGSTLVIGIVAGVLNVVWPFVLISAFWTAVALYYLGKFLTREVRLAYNAYQEDQQRLIGRLAKRDY